VLSMSSRESPSCATAGTAKRRILIAVVRRYIQISAGVDAIQRANAGQLRISRVDQQIDLTSFHHRRSSRELEPATAFCSPYMNRYAQQLAVVPTEYNVHSGDLAVLLLWDRNVNPNPPSGRSLAVRRKASISIVA
jgi:hypothetical protein